MYLPSLFFIVTTVFFSMLHAHTDNQLINMINFYLNRVNSGQISPTKHDVMYLKNLIEQTQDIALRQAMQQKLALIAIDNNCQEHYLIPHNNDNI